MKIEHVALYVSEPVAVARWCSDYLGLRIVRSSGAPACTHFLADSAGTTVLDPTLLHVALATDDVAATRRRLLAER